MDTEPAFVYPKVNMFLNFYSKPACVGCTATQRKLDKHSVPHEKFDILEDANYELVSSLGHAQAPVLTVVSETGEIVDHWSGYSPDKIERYMNGLQER